MKRLLLPLAAFLLVAATACNADSDPDQTLRTAEMAIARGDMTAATSVAQTLTDSVNLSGLSARQLGRLSIIYMQLADSADNASNVATATDAYRRAFRVQPDSAADFYSTLSSDKLPYYMMLSTLAGAKDMPADLGRHEPLDSLPFTY